MFLFTGNLQTGTARLLCISVKFLRYTIPRISLNSFLIYLSISPSYCKVVTVHSIAVNSNVKSYCRHISLDI